MKKCYFVFIGYCAGICIVNLPGMPVSFRIFMYVLGIIPSLMASGM